MGLVPFDENKNSFTAKQVNGLLGDKSLPLYNELTVNALDSNYASPEYIAQTRGHQNLVNVIRLPCNRNVWKRLSRGERAGRRKGNNDNRGASAIYGAKYKLNNVGEWGLPPGKGAVFGVKLASGRNCTAKIDTWEEMMVRSKRGHYMKDKPFRLFRVRLLDAASGQGLFKRDMWLGAWGKRAGELEGEEIYWAYRNRYDAEHFFRFGKQRLLLDKYQTPDEGHLENWLEVVSLAYWLLWVGQKQAKHICPKWQRYGKQVKERRANGLKVSPSQVQVQMAGIISGFDQTPFLPKLKIKGKGRELGQTMPRRKRYPVLVKGKKKKKTE